MWIIYLLIASGALQLLWAIDHQQAKKDVDSDTE